MKIFYSWQSDSPNNTNRAFIRSALEGAVTKIAGELDITDADRPEVDHATKNTRGMIDIRESILKKISEAQLYVPDLTPIARTDAGKELPNANVMYETGWASHSPGYDFIIAVMNTHGNKGPEGLPFDLRGRLLITYELAPDADENTRRAVRNELTANLTGAIRTNFAGLADKASESNPIVPTPAYPADKSLWGVGSNSTMSVPGAYGRLRAVSIRRGPRAYVRVIPASWPSGRPDATDVQAVNPQVQANPEGYSAGSFGTCELGFVRYWFAVGSDGNHETGSLALYIEDTGEYWFISDGPVVEAKIGWLVSLPRVRAFWIFAIKQALAFYDAAGASNCRRIEVGIVGIDKAFMADSQEHVRPQSRKSSVQLVEQQASWDVDRIIAFVRKANGALRSAFSLEKNTDDVAIARAFGKDS